MRVLALLLTLFAGVAAAEEPLQGFAWLAGDWELRSERAAVEERWLPPAGHTMLGLSRTVAKGETVEFEFLRLEARPDGVFYVAQPGGKPPVDFKWNGKSATEAVFENPQHDFPKRISYTRNADGSVKARVDGGAGSPKAQEFLYKPRR